MTFPSLYKSGLHKKVTKIWPYFWKHVKYSCWLNSLSRKIDAVYWNLALVGLLVLQFPLVAVFMVDCYWFCSQTSIPHAWQESKQNNQQHYERNPGKQGISPHQKVVQSELVTSVPIFLLLNFFLPLLIIHACSPVMLFYLC